ncbi:MAG: hypothetical protein LBU09_04115 [Endomicrobium sp.]|jgi:hypothetical protein|nr:hypothetical protein [Endomicrobium sp.]
MGVLEDKYDGAREFYQIIGGSCICVNCGKILTSKQKDEAKEYVLELGLFWKSLICIAIGMAYLFSKRYINDILAVIGFICLSMVALFLKKKGCPICHTNKILEINSQVGKIVFQKFHSEYVNLLLKTFKN